ncbi:GNAT family N-acetyltransferase [Brevibacillus fulvus]|uniref:RimJ/RimL family protein N-acetyltransferase n=1 Tax=Brevibacillus fulvus TaxID=1125967 RepID=A0A939BPG5_9BACL|nr:GNAT family protein [Brevibacillus fulvus]MBM7590445.1 RimJ/RimL family protein N-acetyltransferase [Brevibacillus fulvus]
MLSIEPVTLTGEQVRLEPLAIAHADQLFEAGNFEQIWTYMSIEISRPEDVHSFIAAAMEGQKAGTDLPFAIIDRRTDKAIGSTRLLNISRKDRHVEIGFTWITPAYWKTAVNTECKWLLLRHCFEQLGCVRVQIKTDARNLNSQRAIERLGAVREGLLRNERIVRNGYVRDAVYYSIIDREWPEVKQRLQAYLQRA